MSDHDDDEFDDDSNDSNDSGSNLVKDLRKQLKAQKKALDDAATELTTFRAERRKASVADLITKANGDPRYAKFYTSEDSSEAAVNAWIQAESELLGIKEAEQDDPQSQQVELLTGAVNSAPQVKMGSATEIIDKIRSAKTREELETAYASAFKAAAQ